MTEYEISNAVNRCGDLFKELLSIMQYFNANIKGSPKFPYQKLNLLENLIKHKLMCNMWFNLSMSDNHWQYLIKVLNLNSNGSKTDPPLFESVLQEDIWKRKFVQSNTHLVYACFNARLHALFKYVFIPKFL